jgi:preprotein translocase subunit SecF
LTTTLPLLAIVAFGGQTLKYFALALIIGFVAGAYSSIFVASSLLALWRERTGQIYGDDEVNLATISNQEIESTH